MLITLISIILLVISVVIFLMSLDVIPTPIKFNDGTVLALLLFFMASVVSASICIGLVLGVYCHREEQYIIKSNYYNELKTEIEKSKDSHNHQQLNSDIREFNKEIRENVYCYNNPWTNWFVQDFYCEFEPLEMQ